MNNEDALKRINLEKEKVEKQIEEHERTLPDLMDNIESQTTMLTGYLDQSNGIIKGNDAGDLEWLADDIIDTASKLAGMIRQLSEVK